MASPKFRTARGYALLGLGIGVILFSFVYVITLREHISQRFVWSWVAIHLAVLLGPAVLLGLYGWTRNPGATNP